MFYFYGLSINPAQRAERLAERGQEPFCLWIVLSNAHKDADAPHSLGLLRERRERPHHRRSGGSFDEIASSHRLPQRPMRRPQND